MSLNLNNLVLNERQICDLELLLNGAFKPLEGFMTETEYNSVLDNMTLPNGDLWPIPINLDISSDIKKTNSIDINSEVALRDNEGFLIATLTISDIWKINKEKEALKVYGTIDDHHPGVKYLYESVGDYYLGGKLKISELPKHYDYQLLRHTPKELKKQFKKMGWDKVVAFQTRNPMHRAHKEISFRAASENSANLLLHPVVGPTKPGDIDHYTRVRCYQKILKYFPEGTTMLSLLPLAMRMAGPREALWHALIRKNYGCTHIIIGRDHAGPGNDKDGNPYYGPYEAQELVAKYEKEIKIKMVPFKMMVYVEDIDEYMEIVQNCIEKDRGISIPGCPIGCDFDVDDDYSLGKFKAKYESE